MDSRASPVVLCRLGRGPSGLRSDAEVGWQRQRHGGGYPPFEFELALCDLSPGRSRQQRIVWLTKVARLAQAGPPVVGVYPGPSACRPRGDKDRRHLHIRLTPGRWWRGAGGGNPAEPLSSTTRRGRESSTPHAQRLQQRPAFYAVQVQYSVDGCAVPRPRWWREPWWCVSYGSPKPPLRQQRGVFKPAEIELSEGTMATVGDRRETGCERGAGVPRTQRLTLKSTAGATTWGTGGLSALGSRTTSYGYSSRS